MSKYKVYTLESGKWRELGVFESGNRSALVIEKKKETGKQVRVRLIPAKII